MTDLLKKISFLSLILSIMISLVSCLDDNPDFDGSKMFFNDFEKECENSIWKNILRVENDAAFSGGYVCECTADMIYAFGFNYDIDDSIENANALISIDMKLNAEHKLNSIFVVSVKKDGNTKFWKSFPMAGGFVENQWYDNALSLSLPNDVIEGGELNCYILNDKRESFFIDDFSFELKYFKTPTYLEDVEQYDLPKDLKNVFNTKSLNILYSEKRKQIVIADENDKPLTKPFSLF